MLGPARDARAPSPPPFWCFTSREFLWKQSLEILPSLGSAGHYPGGPAAEPRPAAGVCVCVSVWPWRFITCGSKEALPLEAVLLSSNKGLWPGPPGEQTSTEEATGLALTSPLTASRSFLPASAWAPVSIWLAPSGLASSRGGSFAHPCILCFPSPDPALPITKSSHICPLFPMPIVPPRASFLSSLSSLPVLDVDNIDNIARATFLKCKFDYVTPLLKTLQGLPVAYRVKS